MYFTSCTMLENSERFSRNRLRACPEARLLSAGGVLNNSMRFLQSWSTMSLVSWVRKVVSSPAGQRRASCLDVSAAVVF